MCRGLEVGQPQRVHGAQRGLGWRAVGVGRCHPTQQHVHTACGIHSFLFWLDAYVGTTEMDLGYLQPSCMYFLKLVLINFIF